MLVKAGLEVNLGFDDVVEGFGVAFSFGAGFLGVKHVVGA